MGPTGSSVATTRAPNLESSSSAALRSRVFPGRRARAKDFPFHRTLDARLLVAYGAAFGRSITALLGDELFTEDLARGVSVVTRAVQTNIIDGRTAPERIRLSVFESEKPPLTTALTRGAQERALRAVSIPNQACHVQRVAELRFPPKSEQPARDEVAGGLF